ncbi:hypothetical protein [Natronococcus sp.]|uniref:hypothetical protein n=1 Tax=Natronococcus sp. TaxID=35747 RepID=UPI0025EC9FA0|nr:hypothetical protein [Natronococcus sp.]
MDPYADDLRLPRVRLESEKKATVRCRDCRATFPRSDVHLPTKGTLRCPNCDSGAISDVE